ncbi:MAG TPA: patatin-like phospholipase family protein [Casimicrobiaceae bacterium]|nr:patatin-like phospholipase family protein [Casimicrobiaceae bacterium]
MRRALALFIVATMTMLAGCATRPVNPPIAKFEPRPNQYQFQRAGGDPASEQNLVILAFSGGGTRAAAFSYGVLETLRRTVIEGPQGRRIRLLDQVDTITGVSGGSFTALAYGLYGEKLFDVYEAAFLKRNVQGELISRAFNPANWGAMSSVGRGRSELAADLYDEILFHGATFADLEKSNGPQINASATDIESGSRVVFNRINFDVLCADLGPIRLSRAAAASSAVPVVLSPVTINNYGGSCGYVEPPWTKKFADNPDPPRPAARILQRLAELRAFEDGHEPYLHLVDGGVSDNVGLRGVLDLITTFESLHEAGLPTPLDRVKRIIVFVVNSLSTPATNWNEIEESPGTLSILIKATGVPIDRYSGESVELLKDIAARWKTLREIRDSVAFVKDKDTAVSYVQNVPNAELYTINVSFPALKDKGEREYLNNLPTSFVLTDEEVDRLRGAASKIILESPDFNRLLKDVGARIVETRP